MPLLHLWAWGPGRVRAAMGAGFARMKCGEGLEEAAAPDFAAEVAKTLGEQT